MTLGHKSPKPLRFLKYSLAIGLGGMLFAQSADAVITKGKKECVDSFTKEVKKFSNLDIEKVDPRARCAASDGAKNNQAKITADKREKLEIVKGEAKEGTSFAGACESSYEAVEVVFKELKKARTATCTEIYDTLDEKFPDCLKSKPAESCKDKIEEMAQVYKEGKKKLNDHLAAALKFLAPYPVYNAEAVDAYTQDWNQLKQLRFERRDDIMAGPTTTAVVSRQIDAPAQRSDTLALYLDALDKKPADPKRISSGVSESSLPAISPIGEQAEAKSYLEAFAKKLGHLKEKEDKNFDNQLEIFRNGLKQNLQSVTDDDGYLKKLTTAAPALAPVAGSLLTNTGGAASTIASGTTGALPALALVGAAGAAGIAMGQKNTGSSGLGSSTAGIEGPVMTPNNKAEGTEFGGNGNAQAPAALPGNPLDSTDNANGEKAVQGETAVASNGALAAALGGGASVMPGKSKNNREVASANPSTAPAGDEALKNFGGDLRPSPRPSSSPDSAGNDVSNLLGKMKDLFNMDDSFGGGMPPPDLSSGGPVYPANGGSSGGDDYQGGEYAGGDDYQGEGEYQGGTDETYQGSNPMGDIEVTLFRRVHARHVKCMEKGLVLLMSQELPE